MAKQFDYGKLACGILFGMFLVFLAMHIRFGVGYIEPTISSETSRVDYFGDPCSDSGFVQVDDESVNPDWIVHFKRSTCHEVTKTSLSYSERGLTVYWK